jgi:L-ribulose-5-phosphate 3-epimerase
MNTDEALGRRDFLKLAGATAAVAGMSIETAATRAADAPAASAGLKKAVKASMVQLDGTWGDKFAMLKELGFDGIDMDSYDRADRDAIVEARDETGLIVHGVVFGQSWRDQLSHPDPAVRQRGVEGLKAALEDAKFFGGTTVLLIPAVVSKEVWYDDAYQRSQAEIRKALPLAEKLEVSIALENVWNNFLVSPLEMAQYIDEFENPWLRAYFDVGNCMRYGWPEQWARILGKRIIKLDIKEYSLTKQNEEGLWKGFVDLWEGDCDWPAVMKTIREIGYTDGWGTAEIAGGGPDRMRDIAEKMDRIYAS